MKILLIPVMAFLSTIPMRADYADLVKSGDAEDAKFKFDNALSYYLPAERLEPKNAELLVKISRQYALRINDLPRDADQIASARTALTYAERAVAAAPNECDPHLAVAICLGKLTPLVGAKEKIEASRKIKASADKAVRLGPKNDYAWHLLGRWHQELANIDGATRLMARIIYDGLPTASNEVAVECFKKAIVINPTRLVHVVELGRTYGMMGRKAEAKIYLEKGLSMPNQEKDDPETKLRGKAALKELS